MPDQKQVYLIPVLTRPAPLPFVIAPADDHQLPVMARCGHTAWRLERMTLRGKLVSTCKPNFSWRIEKLAHRFPRQFAPALCTRCRFKAQFEMAIQCAYCGEVIFRGDPVSTYSLDGELPRGFEDRATRTPNGFVGCTREDCCLTVGFFAGHWTGESIRSPYAAGTAAAQAMLSGDITIGPLRS